MQTAPENDPLSAKDRGRDDAIRRERRRGFGLRHLMFVVVLIALLMASIVQFGSVLLAFAILVAPVLLIVSIIVMFLQRRETERVAMLRFLTIASERSMPLAPGVEACAELCGGWYRHRALGLARLLESGVPLPIALDSVPGVLPTPAPMMASVGWAEGTLAPALVEAERAVAVRKQYRGVFVPKLAYLFGIFIAFQIVASFIFYFIFPKFQKIFQDFGMDFPDATVALIRVSQAVGPATGLLPLLVLFQIGLAAYAILLYVGVVSWQPSLLGWFFRNRDRAEVLRILAIGIEAGRPVESTLEKLASVAPRGGIRHRLRRSRSHMRDGEPWLKALRREGLVATSDVALLDAATRAGNLPWGLRTLADLRERRFGYRITMLAQGLFPLCVLLAAAVVGLFVVGMFLPLIHMINLLAR